MRVTYSSSIGNGPNTSSVASRVITENLLNSNMDCHFSNAGITILYYVMPKVKNYNKIKGKLESVQGFYSRLLKTIFTKECEDMFLSTIKGDFLLYSMCSGIHDYNILAHVLNNGVSVVAGGTEINMNSFDYIRNMFIKCGTDKKNLKNLLLIKGHITPHTNLIPIIDNWKDITIPNKNIESIIYAKKDYMKFESMKQIKNIIDMDNPLTFRTYIWPDCISVMFDNKCYWSKCNFCTYHFLNYINYIEGLSANEVIDAITDICNELKTYTVSITDDYFYFSDKKTKIVEELKKNGIQLAGQTGIHFLKNEKFAEKFLNIFDVLSIGLEWVTDFGLKQLNKGFEWKDALKAFENIKKYYNGNIITSNIIADVPICDAQEATLNYNRLLDVKRDMERFNIKWSYTLNMLNIFYQKNFDLFKAAGYIRLPKENKLSGRFAVLKELKKYIELPSFIYFDGIPYERIDKDGNLLESDIDIIDKNIFKEVMNQDFFWTLVKSS